jgi:hypothetical protein
MSLSALDVATRHIGFGSYVTHEDNFGGYDTHMVVDVRAVSVEVVIRKLDNSRTFEIVPLHRIIGVGATPSDAAAMKDRTLAARRLANKPSVPICPAHGADCTDWATL